MDFTPLPYDNQKHTEVEMLTPCMKNLTGINIGVTLAILTSYAIVSLIITPIQEIIFPNWGNVVSLVFLPSGVRIVSVSVFGAKAVPAVFLSEFLCNFYLWGLHDAKLAGTLSLVAACSVLGSFYLAKLLGISVFLTDSWPKLPKTGNLILVSILVSAMNGIGSSMFLYDFIPDRNGGTVALLYVIGDVTGVLVFLFSIYFIFRK